MFQSLAYRALRAIHSAIHTVLWVYKPVDHTRLYPVAGEGRMPRFSILPTEKVWLAWCRVWVACTHGVRGSVAAAIFGDSLDNELRVRRMLRRTRISNRKARRELAQKQRELAEINRKIQAQYMDDNYASW